MSAATVDASLGSLRLRIDETAAHQLRTIRAVTGDTTLSAAIHRVIFDAYMALPSADSVDTGKPCSVAPERPEGGPGQGERTPPAPTMYPLYRHPLAHIHHGTERCVFGEECGR